MLNRERFNFKPRFRDKLRSIGLSWTQVEVCEFAVTYGEIQQVADKMFISYVSVQWHLGIIYRLLGMTGQSSTKFPKLIFYLAKQNKFCE